MAVKNGITTRKPAWLNKKIDLALAQPLKRRLRELKLHTVCESANCPNLSECFSVKNATFMILGNCCTRACAFCAVNKAKPSAVDYAQASRIVLAVKEFKLKYVVITSPTRDDLADGGAKAFVLAVEAIKQACASVKVEILVPDFLGDPVAIKLVANSGADIIGHNLETVAQLYPQIRQGAVYARSLALLKLTKQYNPKVLTKSGIMLGLGETEGALRVAFKDLANSACDYLTLGQYLAPSQKHYPVQQYITLEQFKYYRDLALTFGFKQVQSSPYTRSSYLAADLIK